MILTTKEAKYMIFKKKLFSARYTGFCIQRSIQFFKGVYSARISFIKLILALYTSKVTKNVYTALDDPNFITYTALVCNNFSIHGDIKIKLRA